MREYGTERRYEFDDTQAVIDVRSTKLFLLVRQRNAWRSTTVRHVMNGPTVHLTAEAAANAAERMRKPGNVFIVSAAPALVLHGAYDVVLAADLANPVPFVTWTGELLGGGKPQPGVTMRALTRSLASGQHRFWLNSNERWDGATWLRAMSYEHYMLAIPNRSTFVPGWPGGKSIDGYPVFRSSARVAHERLRWARQSGDVDADPVRRFVRRFNNASRARRDYHRQLRRLRTLWEDADAGCTPWTEDEAELRAACSALLSNIGAGTSASAG